MFNAEHLRRILAKYATYYNEVSDPCFAREGCAVQTVRRTVRRHCRVSGPWRATPSIRTNLVFGSDRGYSGGSTDRPALQRLLVDVKARKVDVIVVYKVDRLTRSLFVDLNLASRMALARLFCIAVVRRP